MLVYVIIQHLLDQLQKIIAQLTHPTSSELNDDFKSTIKTSTSCSPPGLGLKSPDICIKYSIIQKQLFCFLNTNFQLLRVCKSMHQSMHHIVRYIFKWRSSVMKITMYNFPPKGFYIWNHCNTVHWNRQYTWSNKCYYCLSPLITDWKTLIRYRSLFHRGMAFIWFQQSNKAPHSKVG